MKIEVVKRDGAIEYYDESKVERVAIACGLNVTDAENLAANITSQIKQNFSSRVTSLQIRDMFLEDLKKINKAAADLFIWYEDSKDNPDEQAK